MQGDGSHCCSSWKPPWNPRTTVTPTGPAPGLCTDCFKGLLQSPYSKNNQQWQTSSPPSWVLISHSRPLCMNVNGCSESMQNRIINHVFHGFFLPWAMQEKELNATACLAKQVIMEGLIVCIEEMRMFPFQTLCSLGMNTDGFVRLQLVCLFRLRPGTATVGWQVTDKIQAHACLIVSASSVVFDIFNNFKWWGRWCLSSSERTSVSLTGRKQRRKRDGGVWVEDELQGGCRRGDTQRQTASIMGVQQSAAWPSSWRLERSFNVFVCSHTFVFECVGWLFTDVYIPACVCTLGDVCVYVRGTHHKGWQVWTTNEATDWQLVFVAKLAPNLSSLPLPDFKPPFTLMDNMSYFPATLGCCIIKCQITVTHHLDRKCIICGK